MPIVSSPAVLRHQVDEWQRWLIETNPGTNAVLPDVEDLVISVFRCLRHWIDVRALDDRLLVWCTVDLDDVLMALQLLENAPDDPIDTHGLQYYLSAVREGVNSLLGRPLAIEDLDMPDSFHMLDHNLEHALMSVADRWQASHRLVALVRKRIDTLPASAVDKIWCSILRECDLRDRPRSSDTAALELHRHAEDGYGFPVRGSQMVPRGFFATTTALPSLRDRIATYTAWVRSRLFRDAIRSGQQRFHPDRPLGLVRALSLRNPSGLREPSEAERTMARSIGGLCSVTVDSMRLYRSAEELLSLDQHGLVLRTLSTPRPSSGVPRERTLLFHLRRLLTACEDILSDSELPKIHIAERAFLHLQRLIVADPEVRAKWQAAFKKRSGEVACEQLGGAHLLHHGIYAFKSSASGERTDLVLGTRLAITSKIQRSSDAMALTEWKRVRGRVTLDAAVIAARKQALRYTAGSLAGFEISTVRFLVTVSKDVLDERPDEVRGGVTYRHVNIAVAPRTPSARGPQPARSRRRLG